jgi:hypothetical protein
MRGTIFLSFFCGVCVCVVWDLSLTFFFLPWPGSDVLRWAELEWVGLEWNWNWLG